MQNCESRFERFGFFLFVVLLRGVVTLAGGEEELTAPTNRH